MKRKNSSLDQPSLPGVDIERQPALRFESASAKAILDESVGPLNLGKPVPVRVPDFSNPKRPKTCLEVDFPIVPVNALSRLEGNAGKPIYQMSKWWARRRSSVFRAILLAAAMEAPVKRHEDGTPVLDAEGIPVPDETEAAKAVWDVYYANHQKAGNFKDLRVLDCFMGGGTTLVEGSRLGFKVTGVDLNPVAWFVVKNELACTDPEEVKKFFAEIEAEVKPVIQPFYVTECPRGHTGRWFRKAKDGSPEADERMPGDFDPLALKHEERKQYRYEGPEVIYTFWAKHGPCSKHGCNHRTPIFRSPVIAEKKLGVKYIPLTCKNCKTEFHAELGSARMAPAAERVVLESEYPFTELSQTFAQGLKEYGKGSAAECLDRAKDLFAMVETEEGLKCPHCSTFAGEFLRDVLGKHSEAVRKSEIDKKHLQIQPPRNSLKPVYCYLLLDPEWLKGAEGILNGRSLGGYSDAPPDSTELWWNLSLSELRLVELRGRVLLEDEASSFQVEPEVLSEDHGIDVDPEDQENLSDTEADDRKKWGPPHFVTTRAGQKIDTRKGTIPKQSNFTCGKCGELQDQRESVEKFEHDAPCSPYLVQSYCPCCDGEGYPYNGRAFTTPSHNDLKRLFAALGEWNDNNQKSLNAFWPKEEIPETYMTHHANFALPRQGYSHWWKLFNSRQLLVHAILLRTICSSEKAVEITDQALGAFQQYLRNQNQFVFWNSQADKIEPFFSNPNYAPKNSPVENNVFASLGRGNWASCSGGVVEGLEWCRSPWEVAREGDRFEPKVPRIPMEDVVACAELICGSSSEIPNHEPRTFDLVVTDPPFGDNIFYSDLSNFFHVWLRIPLKERFPDQFLPNKTPNTQEALAPRALSEAEGNEYYKVRLAACWARAEELLKDGGLLAFTFHHSEDSQWAIVLESLFDSGFILEQTFPIASDEQKGEGGQFGAKGTEYDIIHVCRKRLVDPQPVSWAKMRQWVKAELARLRTLLATYRERQISDADVRVILRGKALEFYSRHYGKVLTAEDEPMPLTHALAGINQLLDEGSGDAAALPPSLVQPVAYQYLRLFSNKDVRTADDVNKSLFGTAIRQKDIADRGWISLENKVVTAIPIAERFELHRKRPRKEMKTEIDQAHFLIGAAMPNSGVNLEDELSKDTWMLRKSVDSVLEWYGKVSPHADVRNAAVLARTILQSNLQKLRERPGALEAQLSLFNDWEEAEA